MSRRTRPRAVPRYAGALALCLAFAAPASAGLAEPVLSLDECLVQQPIGDDFLSVPVEGINVDNFLGTAPNVVNPLTGIGGGDIDLELLGRNTQIVGDALGLTPPLFTDAFGGFQKPPDESVAAFRSVLQHNLQAQTGQQAADLGAFLLSGVGVMPQPGDFFGAPIPDMPDFDPQAAQELLAEAGWTVPDDLGGSTARRLLGTDDVSGLPIGELVNGARLYVVEAEQVVGPPAGTSGYAEVHVSGIIPSGLVVNDRTLQPTDMLYNSVTFPWDSFNESNLAIGVKVDESGQELFTKIHDGAGWPSIPDLVPMFAHQNKVTMLFPAQLAAAMGEYRTHTFASATPQPAPDSVGTSSDTVIGSNTTYDFPTLALEDDPLVVSDGILASYFDVPTSDPEPEPEVDPNAGVSDTPVTPDDNETPELIDPRPGIEDPAETPDGTTRGTRTWVAVALITIGSVTLALGYWVYNRTRVRKQKGDGDHPRDVPEEHTKRD